MYKLWQKDWQLDKFIETFETKDDLVLDQQLVDFDIYCSIAHAQMLTKINIITEAELKRVTKALAHIQRLNQKGEFKLKFGDEDIHTKIENFLVENCGEVGKKIHTGRSRNDQVLAAIRLFTKDELLKIWENTLTLTESLIKLAKKHENVLMPGYTHMQKAMPSSVGFWAASFVNGLIDDIEIFKAAYKLNNQSPLGSAAGFGVPLLIDRELTAKLLSFDKPQENSIYVQNSRGKIEATIVAALINILFEINKFSTDVLLYTSSEFNFFQVSAKLCSGSSIMPQKRNVDVAELLRSKVHILLGYYIQLVSTTSNLMTGYNRDFQSTKKPFFESLDTANMSIQAVNLIVNNIKPNHNILQQSMTTDLYATHQALKLVKEGMPFRQAYQEVAKSLSEISPVNSFDVFKESVHTGSIGNLGLDKFEKKLEKEKKVLAETKHYYQNCLKKLTQV